MTDRPPRSSHRLTPLTLALLVGVLLLGSTGGAVAGALITGKQIKDGTVTGTDIKDSSLTGVDVKDGSLTAADLLDKPAIFGASVVAPIDDFTSKVFVPIVSRTVVTRAGILTVTGNFYAEDDVSLNGTGYLRYRLKVDGKVLDYTSPQSLTYTGAGAGGSATPVVTVPVKAGSHTVALEAFEVGAGSYIYGGQISAVYSATGSVTGPALVAPKVAARSYRQGQR